jgi:hypothetical protein
MCIYLIIFHVGNLGIGNLDFGKLGIGNLGCYQLDIVRHLYLVYFRINGKQLLVQNPTVLTRN